MMENNILINGLFLISKGGIERFSYELVKRLSSENKFRFVILVPDRKLNQDQVNAFPEHIEIEIVPGKGGVLWSQIFLPFYIYKKYYGSLLVNLGNYAPVIYNHNLTMVHDIIPLVRPHWISLKPLIYSWLLLPLTILRSKKICTGCNNVKEILTKYFFRKNIDIIHSASNWATVKVQIDNISERPIIDGQYILCVASNDPRKNLNRLIQSFVKLNRDGLKLYLVTKNLDGFEKWIPREMENEIIATGWVSDTELVNIYKNAELFVFPSLIEGFGIPPIEAMSLECPVLASNKSCIPEICGDAAEYFNPYNIVEMSDKISMILDDQKLKKDLIELGKVRAMRYSWDQSVRQLVNVIKCCCKK